LLQTNLLAPLQQFKDWALNFLLPKAAFVFCPQRKKALRSRRVPPHACLLEPLLQHAFVPALYRAAADEIAFVQIAGVIYVGSVVADAAVEYCGGSKPNKCFAYVFTFSHKWQ